MKLSEVGEFGLIKRLAEGCINDPSTVVKGIGDDAAVLQPVKGGSLLVTSDMLVEGVHFLPGKITFSQLGHKSVAVSLSDIAAMGGIPRHALVSLAVPEYMTVEDVEELYRGMKAILSRHRVNLVGGDTVKSPVLTIDVTVLGEAPPSGAMTREGARPGDAVMVTGYPGSSAAGLELLINPGDWADNLRREDREILLKAHLTPEPALLQAATLMEIGCVTSMIDISDGIASEINHICDNNGVGAVVMAGRIPISGPAMRAAGLAGKNPVDWALYGGEDYQLLFTVPTGEIERIVGVFAEQSLGPVTEIGRITEESEGRKIILYPGVSSELIPASYNHFAKDR